MQITVVGNHQYGIHLIEEFPICLAFCANGEAILCSVETVSGDIDPSLIIEFSNQGGFNLMAIDFESWEEYFQIQWDIPVTLTFPEGGWGIKEIEVRP